MTAAARTAARTAPPKENLFRAKLHQDFAAELKAGEQLRWFGLVYQYKAPAFLVGLLSWSIVLPIFGPLVAMALRRPWAVGVTSERVLLGHYAYERSAKGPPQPLVSISLGEVAVLRKGPRTGRLVLTHRVGALPAEFRLVRGHNVDDLEALLHA